MKIIENHQFGFFVFILPLKEDYRLIYWLSETMNKHTGLKTKPDYKLNAMTWQIRVSR